MQGAERLTHSPIAPPGKHTNGGGGKRRPIDILVGRQLRRRRLELGLSHEDLGVAVDVHPMRIVAYERGDERIMPAHLVRFSELLGVKLRFFFPGT